MESTRKGGVSYEKEGKKYEKSESFAKLKSTIMTVRQRDSEAGEVDKGKGSS